MHNNILREYKRRLIEAGYAVEQQLDGITALYKKTPVFYVSGTQAAKAKDLSNFQRVKANEASKLYVQVSEYVAAYENAGDMEEIDGYRQILSYNGTFLGVRDNGDGGYSFIISEEKNIKHFSDYEAAKHNFSIRSGLINKHRHPVRTDRTAEQRTYNLHYALYPTSCDQKAEQVSYTVTATGYADAICRGWETLCNNLEQTERYSFIEFIGLTWNTDPSDLQDYLNQMVSESEYQCNLEILNGAETQQNTDGKMLTATDRIIADFSAIPGIYPPQSFMAVSCAEKAVRDMDFKNPASREYLQNAVDMVKNGYGTESVVKCYTQGIKDTQNGLIFVRPIVPPTAWDMSEGFILRDAYSGKAYNAALERQAEDFSAALKSGDTELAEDIYNTLSDARAVSEYADLAALRGLEDIALALMCAASSKQDEEFEDGEIEVMEYDGSESTDHIFDAGYDSTEAKEPEPQIEPHIPRTNIHPHNNSTAPPIRDAAKKGGIRP